jgi:hypothetical protein
MARFVGPRTVTSGLLLYLDAANTRSYPGSGTAWTDLSGNDRNGTLTNVPTYSSANGGSIVFDGADDYVNTVYTPPSTFTINLWFNNTTTYNVHNRGVFSTYSLVTYNGIYLATTNTGGAGMHIYANSNLRTRLNYDSFTTGVWYNISITSSSGTILVYLNSSLINTISNSTSHADVLQIGRSRFDTNYWNGNISNFIIYNRVLTAAEVAQNYNALRGRYGV